MDDKSELDTELERIDNFIAEAKEAIEKGKALERLMCNEDFTNIIVDGYFESEARKLFDILIDPTGASPYSEEQINSMLAGISHFRGYIGTGQYPGTIRTEAERAPLDIIKEEEYRIQVTAEWSKV